MILWHRLRFAKKIVQVGEYRFKYKQRDVYSQPPISGSVSATGTLLIRRAEFPLLRSRESVWKGCCTVWSSSSPKVKTVAN